MSPCKNRTTNPPSPPLLKGEYEEKYLPFPIFFVKEKLSSPSLEKEKILHRPLKKEKFPVSLWSKKTFHLPL
jgi:hypothetical protein